MANTKHKYFSDRSPNSPYIQYQLFEQLTRNKVYELTNSIIKYMSQLIRNKVYETTNSK
jgi:hypothetical protein